MMHQKGLGEKVAKRPQKGIIHLRSKVHTYAHERTKSLFMDFWKKINTEWQMSKF